MVEFLASCPDTAVDHSELLPCDRPEETGRRPEVLALRDLALQLQQQGVDGVEIWARLTQAALEVQRDGFDSPQDQLDRALQDVAVVTVGRQPLEDNLGLLSLLGGARTEESLDQLGELYDGLPAHRDPYFAGTGLDPTDSRSFRDDIADGTDNQIYHTGFFQYVSYATDSAVPTLNGSDMADLGNGAHELWLGAPLPTPGQAQVAVPAGSPVALTDCVRILPDGGINWSGQTLEDLEASFAGADLGFALQVLRNHSQIADHLHEVPDLIRGAYGRDRESLDPTAMPARVLDAHDPLSGGGPWRTWLRRHGVPSRAESDAEHGRSPEGHDTQGDGDLEFAHMIIDHYEAMIARGEATPNLTTRLEVTLTESGLPESLQAAVRRRIARQTPPAP